jgi:hypothetical protein
LASLRGANPSFGVIGPLISIVPIASGLAGVLERTEKGRRADVSLLCNIERTSLSAPMARTLATALTDV